MSFVHLHLHTEYSFLDGSIKIKDLFERVKELGQNAVAITEHGHMHALIQKYKLAKAAGVKLIVGVEIYLCDDIAVKDKKRYHFILLAKDNEGLANLNKIVSIANTEGFYYKPRIDKNVLRKYSKGLIATSACIAGDLPRAINAGDLEKAKSLALEYEEIFGKGNFYLEVHNHGIPEERGAIEGIVKVSKELGIPIVAANDAHYLKEDDVVAHDILLCIQTKKKVADEDRLKFAGSGFYVKSEEEMRSLFPDLPEAIENTGKIADCCNVSLDLGNTYFPEFDVPQGETYDSVLLSNCEKALDVKYEKGTDLYKQAFDRMTFELDVIQKMGFSAYFLIVADFIDSAKEFCQVGPGRGSGAGSIVAYLLGITQLEPLGLNLLFERFLNPERVSLPDFDVDFGDRDKVLDYVRSKYGEDKVALIGTYGQMKSKAVLKDVARAIDIPFEIANKMTKFLTEKTIQKALDLKDEGGNLVNKDLIEYEKHYPFLFEIAKKLEGTVRQPGIHACGVVWGPNVITDYMCVFQKDANIVTQLDKNEVEERGLVKFDFLGLETLNIIQNILNFINKDGEWLEKIPLGDDKVYDMLAAMKSTGVFQIESAGMRKTLDLVQPNCFDDIIAIVALYRPGPMQYLEVYARRKHGEEEVVYPHPWAEEILSPTYGIMVYQEQVMQLAQKLAGFTMGQADVLRKAIGKKKLDLMMKCEEQFKEGCINVASMEKKVVDKLWDDIVKFAAYSFNKSHAAAYALISYRTAYLKYHYLTEFYTAIISSVTDDMEKMAEYIAYAKDEGIRILSPSINRSERNFTFEKDDKGGIIRFGFSGIKNVGDSVIDEILLHRPYKSFQDFINKVDLSKVNKRVLKNLIMCGAFDNLLHNRNELLAAYEDVKKMDDTSKQRTLFGTVADECVIPEMPDCSLGKILEFEVETLGLPISGHLLDKYPASSNPRFDKLTALVDEREFECFVLVRAFRRIVTKKGDYMAFISVMDRYGVKDVVVFPNVFREIEHQNIVENTPLIIEGVYRDGSMICSSVRVWRESSGNNGNLVKETESEYKKKDGSKNQSSLLSFC